MVPGDDPFVAAGCGFERGKSHGPRLAFLRGARRDFDRNDGEAQPKHRRNFAGG